MHRATTSHAPASIRHGRKSTFPADEWRCDVGKNGGGKLEDGRIHPTSPNELIRDFHQGEGAMSNSRSGTRDVSRDSFSTGGGIWNGNQIILLGTDNRDAFSWLDNKIAKKGLALRIAATFHARGVMNGIEAYPFFLRSLHSARPDFTTRESDHEIERWAET